MSRTQFIHRLRGICTEKGMLSLPARHAAAGCGRTHLKRRSDHRRIRKRAVANGGPPNIGYRMNKLDGMCLGPKGLYAYEAMWSIAGVLIVWDSRVSLAGEVIGTPGGIICGAGQHHVADVVEADGMQRHRTRHASPQRALTTPNCCAQGPEYNIVYDCAKPTPALNGPSIHPISCRA